MIKDNENTKTNYKLIITISLIFIAISFAHSNASDNFVTSSGYLLTVTFNDFLLLLSIHYLF